MIAVNIIRQIALFISVTYPNASNSVGLNQVITNKLSSQKPIFSSKMKMVLENIGSVM
jgi:hypothetical protein